MKLLFLSSGRTTPTYRFRVWPLVRYLRQAGHSCAIANSFPEKYDSIACLGFRASQWLKRCNRYIDLYRTRLGRFDAIILERELFHNPSIDLERKFRSIAQTMILDIDDAVFMNFPEKMVELTGFVDLVLAGNQALIEWTKKYNPHVEWMPTCIDLQRYRQRSYVSPHSLLPVVGWMGTSGNLNNIKEIAAGLREAARQVAFEFCVVSDRRDILDAIDLQGVTVNFVRWSPRTEIELLSRFDIGIMPLCDNRWNQFKCGGKLLQYMGLGIPGIASPVGVNSEMVIDGENGYLASTQEEWRLALVKLISDEQLRRRLGAAARSTIENRFNMESHALRWIAAVEATVARSRSGLKPLRC